MLLLSIAYLIQSRSLKEVNSFRGVELSGYANVALTIVVLMIDAMLLEPIGFVASSALTIAALAERNLEIILAEDFG